MPAIGVRAGAHKLAVAWGRPPCIVDTVAGYPDHLFGCFGVSPADAAFAGAFALCILVSTCGLAVLALDAAELRGVDRDGEDDLRPSCGD